MPFEDLIVTVLQWAFWIAIAWGLFTVLKTFINKTGEVLKARKPLGNKAESSISGNIKRYDSALEMITAMIQGCEMQLEAIRGACIKANTDPLKDVGYKTIQENLVKLRDYQTKLQTNPFYAALDDFGYPVLKNVSGGFEKFLKGVFKGEF